MVQVLVIVREVGRMKPDYSLGFDLPALPRVGDYISIQRPNKPKPYGEDLIVRQVWWRLNHPETAGFSAGQPKVGSVEEIYVECDPAVGPWSSDQWRDSLQSWVDNGTVKEMDVERLSIRQDEIEGK
jgi:hypothetical protein